MHLAETDILFGKSPEKANITLGCAFSLNTVSEKVRLLQLNRDDIPEFSNFIMSIFLSDQRCFFNYTSVQSEVTIVCDLDRIVQSEELSVHPLNWSGIQISAGLTGFDCSSSDVVSFVSHTLSKNDIPLYYLSTVHEDFVLVPTTSNALETLETASKKD
eukprot:TRINITY_DN2043_c0_g1_i3.p1 TRINITY_DN2043_c0_g1~~TRINITY_DN2043_c0_g1_i3.p1  ORF type:complete len:159 (+),score=27.03 TRINITY_DN2043_c0_g1_i3:985-1461(+)